MNSRTTTVGADVSVVLDRRLNESGCAQYKSPQ